ncbi:MAG: TetR/AcrR family transcriptional regulator [Comamonadaceae bacterium]|nr:TetR/AcrR family transcriptional regulator [Comamonadaceae bacterium]
MEGGFDNVRVLVIAQTLGVTRGSFYWHFNDHADLVSSLIARWREREVELDRALQLDATEDPKADLEHLLEAALAMPGPILKTCDSSWRCVAWAGATRSSRRCWSKSMRPA